jgi:hypothetical protein
MARSGGPPGLPDPTEIDNLQAQAQKAMGAIDEQVSSLDPAVSIEVRGPIGGLRSVVIGDDSIFSWVRRAIGAKAESRRLIAEDGKVSARLKIKRPTSCSAFLAVRLTMPPPTRGPCGTSDGESSSPSRR